MVEDFRLDRLGCYGNRISRFTAQDTGVQVFVGLGATCFARLGVQVFSGTLTDSTIQQVVLPQNAVIESNGISCWDRKECRMAFEEP